MFKDQEKKIIGLLSAVRCFLEWKRGLNLPGRFSEIGWEKVAV